MPATNTAKPSSPFEGMTNFDGLQQFLACVATLCRERLLLRYLYTAQKPG
jgi:hypothetical protein